MTGIVKKKYLYILFTHFEMFVIFFDMSHEDIILKLFVCKKFIVFVNTT